MSPVVDVPPAAVATVKKSKATAKQERVHLRVTQENKGLLEEAAALSGVNVTDYATQALVEAALNTIERHRITRLNYESNAAFYKAIDSEELPEGASALLDMFDMVRLS